MAAAPADPPAECRCSRGPFSSHPASPLGRPSRAGRRRGRSPADTAAAADAAVLGTGLSGKAARFSAISACPVTQTGVWSLEAE